MSVPAVLRDADRLAFGDQELLFRSRVAADLAGELSVGNLRSAPTTALHENRLATILVVDIRDFTPLARTLSESLLAQPIGAWFLRTGRSPSGSVAGRRSTSATR